MWQPVQTPCSTATMAESPLLAKSRSNRFSKSSSIFSANSFRSFSSSCSRVSSAFDFSPRSFICREIESLVAAAFFSSAVTSTFDLSRFLLESLQTGSAFRQLQLKMLSLQRQIFYLVLDLPDLLLSILKDE